jgi:hypothetical protein
VRGREQEVVKRVDTGFAQEKKLASTRSARRKVFVIMPFAKDFDDVYILGIREVAAKLGLVVERADNIEHNIQILEVIQQRIRDAELIVADTSLPNPNVFYEVGYAHAFLSTVRVGHGQPSSRGVMEPDCSQVCLLTSWQLLPPLPLIV